DRMGLELPVEEADTLGGFVFGLMGHQPDHSEEVTWSGMTFGVEATDGRRIQKLRVTRLPAQDPPNGSAVPAPE
ncbi:MAG: HlyC/CorC family transporter, partial [Armatimonadetes bacterium]|nr:HlyC/CorC family transporter [Armatimonadota bacterium]